MFKMKIRCSIFSCIWYVSKWCPLIFLSVANCKYSLEQLNSKVREVPAHLRENTKKLESEKKKNENLLELNPAYESIITIKRTEIPNLKYVHIL
jgi:hypothetical protein